MDSHTQKQQTITYLDLRNGSKLDSLLAMGKPIILTKRGKQVANITPKKQKKANALTRKKEIEEAINTLRELGKKAHKIPDNIKIDRTFIYES